MFEPEPPLGNQGAYRRGLGCLAAAMVALAVLVGLMWFVTGGAFLDVLTWQPGRYDTVYGWAAPFDRQKWLADPDGRAAMARDLVVSDRLRGMTRSEVLDLLGEPYRDPSDPEPVLTTVTVSWAGRETVDPAYVRVWFDDDGHVLRYAYVPG